MYLIKVFVISDEDELLFHQVMIPMFSQCIVAQSWDRKGLLGVGAGHALQIYIHIYLMFVVHFMVFFLINEIFVSMCTGR
jgi:hypothetical protein